jgi:hypothetical protein
VKAGPNAILRGRAVLAAVLAVAVFVELNYLSCLRHDAADWSRGAVFTLSARTRRFLADLGRGVELTALCSESLEAAGLGRAELLRRVLDRYASASDRVAVRFVDPDRQPAAFAETVRRRDFLLARSAEPGAVEQGVLVESGERAAFRTLDELFPPPAEDDRSSSVPVAVEAGVTAALLEVTAAERPIVCLTTGHGEWDLAGPEGEQLLRAHLESEAYDVRPLDAAALAADLERCAAVVVVGPRRGFAPREAEALRRRLEEGGRFLVLLDAAGTGSLDSAAGLAPLLARAGIEASRAGARETDSERMYDPGSATLVLGSVDAAFAPAASLAGRPVAMLQAAGLRRFGSTGTAVPLVGTAPSTVVEGWGGGAALGMAAEVGACGAERSSCGRLVVFGGSTLLFPPFAARPETANLALALQVLAWLVDRPGALPLPPVAAERVRLFLSPATLRGFWWWLVVGMPVGMALAGLVVLRARRREGA